MVSVARALRLRNIPAINLAGSGLEFSGNHLVYLTGNAIQLQFRAVLRDYFSCLKGLG